MPPHSRAAVVESLVKNIQQHSYHTTSGILGTRAQYEALAKNGRMDVALAMLNKTDFPSYGYMVANADEPATTLWEKCAYSFHSVEGCAALVCAAAEPLEDFFPTEFDVADCASDDALAHLE